MSRATWRRWRWVRVLASIAWLGFVLAMVLLELSISPASADNCSVFTDCFGQSEAASEAALGLTFLAALSLVIDFIPVVGDVKGIIELGTGRDLLTGEELEPWERALGLIGLIPGGDLLRLAKLGDAAGGVASGARAADGFGDVGSGAGGLGRVDGPSAGRPSASASVPSTGRGDGFDPFDLQSGATPRPVSPESPLPPLRPGGQPATPTRPPGEVTPPTPPRPPEPGGSSGSGRGPGGGDGGSGGRGPGDGDGGDPRPPRTPEMDSKITEFAEMESPSKGYSKWKQNLAEEGFSSDEISEIVYEGALARGENPFGNNWKKYYEEISGTSFPGPPQHAHHLVEKVGGGVAGETNRAILREVGIDPLLSRENFAWAPNVAGQHGVGPQAELLERLLPARGDHDAVVQVLRDWVEVAQGR